MIHPMIHVIYVVRLMTIDAPMWPLRTATLRRTRPIPVLLWASLKAPPRPFSAEPSDCWGFFGLSATVLALCRGPPRLPGAGSW